MARVFGDIPGNPPGSTFPDRATLSGSGVHRPPQAGTSGSVREGADSIVVSGGYEDDEDYGDVIVYTGAGGRDPATGRQIKDQELTGQNYALALSGTDGLPVRVVRGRGGDPAYSPATGYRYDGLYRIDDFWEETGKSGFEVIRFRLVKMHAEPAPLVTPPASTPPGPAPRVDVRTQQIVRNAAVTHRVKELHRHRCQVCGVQIQTATGPYA